MNKIYDIKLILKELEDIENEFKDKQPKYISQRNYPISTRKILGKQK